MTWRSKNNQTEEKTVSWGKTVWKSENIAKPKELWETLKSLGLPNKKSSPSNISLKYKNGSLFESLSIAGNFKRYYSSLGENLVLKLPKPPNNFWNTISEYLLLEVQVEGKVTIFKNWIG